MNKRKVVISPYQLGGIDAYNKVLNFSEFTEHCREIDLVNLFYTCIIQLGIQKIEIPQLEFTEQIKSKFLKKYISYISIDENRIKLYAKFEKEIKKYFIDDIENNSNVLKFKYFCYDIFLSLERNADIVNISPYPIFQQDNIKNLEFLPDELLYPFEILLNSFEYKVEKLPVPKIVIHKNNIQKFKEIIESDLFLQYSAEFNELNKDDIKVDSTISNIREIAFSIKKKYKELLDWKEIIISLTPIIADIIRTSFGSIPGSIADLLKEILENYMKQSRRVVIYDFWPIFEDIFYDRFSRTIDDFGEKRK